MLIDNIALFGFLLAVAGALTGVHAIYAMRKFVNSTRPEGQKIEGFFLAPSTLKPAIRVLKAEHPNPPFRTQIVISVASQVVGIAIIMATNTYNAHHSS